MCYRTPKNQKILKRDGVTFITRRSRGKCLSNSGPQHEGTFRIYMFLLLCLPNMACFRPPLQILEKPRMCWALRPQPKAWAGASTDNFVRGRFNGLSEVGVVLFSLLFKQASIYRSQNSRVKISNSSFYIRCFTPTHPPGLIPVKPRMWAWSPVQEAAGW